jgi:hypothetical protein
MTRASGAPAPAGGGPAGSTLAWLVFGLFACVFLLNAPDRGPAGDAHDYFVPVQSLVDHGQLSAPPQVRIDERNLVVAPDGGRYTLFPAGQSLAMLPFYALGRLAGLAVGSDVLPIVVLNGSSAVFAALAVLFVWLTLLRVFEVPPHSALLGAALYACGTMLLPYGKVLYSEALQSALVAALVYFGLAPATQRTLPALAAAFGLLVLTKPVHLVLLPLVALAAYWNGALRLSTRASMLRAAALAGCCAVLFFAWNFVRTGSPFDAYGSAPAHLTQNQLSLGYLPESLRVLFASPWKNLFVFNPVLGLALAGAVLPMRGRQRVFLLGLFATQLVAFGVFRSGTSQGAIAWGPRYAMVFLPVLMPFVGALLGWVGQRPPATRVVALLVCACVALMSVYVQVLGSSYDFFGPKLALCGTYEELRADRAGLLPCDGEDLPASIVAVHHYLLWSAKKRDVERGQAVELPWITKRFSPSFAQRVLMRPGVRARAMDKNYLFFGLPGGAGALRTTRGVLVALALFCAVLYARLTRAPGR